MNDKVETVSADEKLSSAESNGRMPVHAVPSDGMHAPYDGITKRELFAIHMMASICTTHSGGSINANDSDLEYLSEKAVRSADALLKELAK